MKIPLFCFDCLYPRNEAGEETGAGAAKVFRMPVVTSGVYNFTCAQGHRVTCFLSDEHFQVLFDLALHAIVDGYYREAVATASASLERFYEFVFRLVQQPEETKDDLGNSLSAEAFAASWKLVEASSERQLGLFVGTFLSHFKTMPELLPPSGSVVSASFRNKVIHKGEIPLEEQAIDYACGIFELIVANLKTIREGAKVAMGKRMARSATERLSGASTPISYATLTPTIRLFPPRSGHAESKADVIAKIELIRQGGHYGIKVYPPDDDEWPAADKLSGKR